MHEVHHRVKNNMQVIISMIDLQCEKIADKQICDELKKTVDRINSMVLVHNQLFISKDFDKIKCLPHSSDLKAMFFLPIRTKFFLTVVGQAVKPAPPHILSLFPGFIDIG